MQKTSLEEAVLAGLLKNPKELPSAYFYDAEGSRLFSRIMTLPGYYLSRAETEILRTASSSIADACSRRQVVLVDLGAGDGTKTSLLVDALMARGKSLTYAPVDICPEALANLEIVHADRHPCVPVLPFVGDYADGLGAVRSAFPNHQLIGLFLGSNLGNLSPEAAGALLGHWQQVLSPGDLLLLGLDLVKDPRVLQAAYDDAEGLTSAFNLNLLERMNRELGSDFDPASFRHYARLNPAQNAMESYLVSTREQRVRVGDECIRFAAWEAMQTERSCKYRESDVAAFARSAGLSPVAWFYDSHRWFLDVLLRVGRAVPQKLEQRTHEYRHEQ